MTLEWLWAFYRTYARLTEQEWREHYERMAYYNRRLAEGDALTAQLRPYTRYVPSDEVPF